MALPINPQAQPQQQAQAAPTPQQQQPMQQSSPASGRAGQPYNPQLLAEIEKHLSQLPDQQKAYLVQYMTPELAIILGIVLGTEAYDYFRQFADPKKMLVVQPRGQQQQTAGNVEAPQQAPAQQPVAKSVNTQPKANTPAKSIMGV